MPPNPHADFTAPDEPTHPAGSLREYVTSLRGYPKSAWKAAIACVLAMALSPAALNATITFFVEPASTAVAGGNTLILTLFAATAFGYVAIMGVFYKVVAEWFPHHRGWGYSLLIGAAASLGGAILAPLCQLSIDSLGWRQTARSRRGRRRPRRTT
jgi:MFS family permease